MAPAVVEQEGLEISESVLFDSDYSLNISGVKINIMNNDSEPFIIPVGTMLHFDNKHAPNTLGGHLIHEVIDVKVLAKGLAFAKAISFHSDVPIHITTDGNGGSKIRAKKSITTLMQLFISLKNGTIALIPRPDDRNVVINSEPLAEPFNITSDTEFVPM